MAVDFSSLSFRCDLMRILDLKLKDKVEAMYALSVAFLSLLVISSAKISSLNARLIYTRFLGTETDLVTCFTRLIVFTRKRLG